LRASFAALVAAGLSGNARKLRQPIVCAEVPGGDASIEIYIEIELIDSVALSSAAQLGVNWESTTFEG
jgi:hypothetical protein